MTNSRDNFPLTRHSAIRLLASVDTDERTRGLDILIRAYWKPVYKYLRLKWHREREAAEDLTQGFFAAAIEKQFFEDFDPTRARFRTYLRTCLDRYVSKEQAAASRLKRGGDIEIVSLDFGSAELEYQQNQTGTASPDDFFDNEWTRSVFAIAVSRLKEHFADSTHKIYFEIFVAYDLQRLEGVDKISYADMADQFQITVSDVTNHLAAARRQFRAFVLEVIAELTASDEEYNEEIRSLLGNDAT